MAVIDFKGDNGRDWHIDVGEEGGYFIVAGDRVIMRDATTEQEALDAACAIIARFADECAQGRVPCDGIDPSEMGDRGEIALRLIERMKAEFEPMQ